NDGWPPTRKLTLRHTPKKSGYFASSKAWAVAIDTNSAANAIEIDPRLSMAVLPCHQRAKGSNPRAASLSFGTTLPHFAAPKASMPPLDRAAHGRHLLHRAAPGFSDRFHRLEEVAARVGDRRHARGVEPPAVLQFVPGVEAEEIRGALRVIG